MIVDTHVHPLSDDRRKYPRIGDHGAKGAVKSVTDIGQPEWPDFPLDALIAAMNESGIDKATLVQAYYTYHHDNSYAIEGALADPNRFTSVVVIDELAPDAPAMLEHLVRDRNVRGWRMMGAQDKGFFRDPRLVPLWAKAEALGIPVLAGARVDELPDLLPLIERFTGTIAVIEHSWANKVGNPPAPASKPLLDLARFPHVRLKVSTPNCFAIREAKVPAREFWRMLVDSFGAHRMMWGSNYPAHWHKHGKIKERLAMMREDLAFLPEADRNQIFGEAALAVWPSLR